VMASIPDFQSITTGPSLNYRQLMDRGFANT
jgi:hypothetical protein